MEAQQIQIETATVSGCNKRLLVSHLPIRFDAEPSLGKAEVNQHIKRCFSEAYGAKITSFEAYILSTHGDAGITATIGFQPAAMKKPLFLESYLATSIEETLSATFKQAIERHQIVEVGNLSSTQRGSASRILFILSVAILYQAGFQWVTFTATKQVQRLLGKLNLSTVPICDADPSKLADKGESWGSYYDDRPMVEAGNLKDAMQQLRSHEVIKSILNNYQATINDIAQKIKIS